MTIPYGYACDYCGTQFDIDFERGAAPGQLRRDHGCKSAILKRDYSSISVSSNDPIRKGWLSSSIEHNLAEQQRPLDPIAPKDKFEAEHVRKQTGRVYFGNDTSKLNPKARKVVESRTLERASVPGMSKD